MKNTRAYAIINGKQELSTVVANLGSLFRLGDPVLLYTKHGRDEVLKGLDGFVREDEIQYAEWNDWKAEDYVGGRAKRVVVMKMPKSLYKTLPHCYNDIFRFIDNTDFCRYVHFFSDDIKFANEHAEDDFNPYDYEWFMDTFDERLLLDGKLNVGNFAFKKMSPRFVYVSSLLRGPLSFFQFEGKDHFVVDREKFKQNFDENLKRLYMAEYLIRAHAAKVVKHMTFYPDPVAEQTFVRDVELPLTRLTEEIGNEFAADEKYIRDVLHGSIEAESEIGPIIAEMKPVMERLAASRIATETVIKPVIKD